MLTKKSALFAFSLLCILFYITPHLVVASGDTTVNVINFAYDPATVTIQEGDTVTWTNTEGFHTVDADNGTFGNDPGSGWTFTHTFTTAGSYEYFCEVHSTATGDTMNGVIIVEEAPTAVTVSDMDVTSAATWLAGTIVAGSLLAIGVGVIFRRTKAA